MNDQTPDPRDDVLRAALHAEAEGVTADADLLARIQTAARQGGGRTTGRWLLVAAAALVAGLGVTVLNRDDDQVVDSANDPSTTSTSTTTGTQPDIYDVLSGAFPCDQRGRYQTVYFLASEAEAQLAAVSAALNADPRVQSVRPVPRTETTAVLEQAAPGVNWASIPWALLATSRTSEDDLAARSAVADLPGITATVSTDCTDPSDQP